jgi:hypothetical protein
MQKAKAEMVSVATEKLDDAPRSGAGKVTVNAAPKEKTTKVAKDTKAKR